jgi:hypothetical protein
MHCFLSEDGVSRRPLSWKERTRIILQVAEGTLYTSPNPIISRSLRILILQITQYWNAHLEMLINLGFLTIIDMKYLQNYFNNLFLLFENKCKNIMLQELLLLWLTQLQEI